ncbi:MAG: BatA domain-containing protein [Flavobacteriaceae bacterium]|nr:BatA domain-containing protein [Flavobacteriaceae bacterium]
MQFKHPEILYALFLLLIPVIVHLFQLRRFEKVPFTNVKFLKQVEIQTRKSSKLKKFLILCTRLLALTGLVVAFAQPFLSSIKKDDVRNTYIYLDNSMSMQAKGDQGELLKRAVQDIVKTFGSAKNVNLITNDRFYKNLSGQDLKRELLEIDYHPINGDISNILFKINNDLETKIKNSNEIILLSDFQNFNEFKLDSLNTYSLVQLAPVRDSNISIDSVYISDQNSENITLNAVLKSYNISSENIAVSLYSGDILQGKSNISLAENDSKTTKFVVRNTDDFNGRLSLNDNGLLFDNEFYFSVNKQDNINVLAIGTANDFLSKIYTNDEFSFSSTNLNQLDYSQLNEQNLIILNELESINNSLISSLSDFLRNGGSLVIIPHKNSDVNSYNTLYNNLQLGSFGTKIENKLAVTDINFSHPVLKNVFEKQIKNFQYPTVNSYFRSNSIRSSSVLSFDNESPFIRQVRFENGEVYLLTAAISKENSNFKNSPLIVPVFYNFGKLSYKHSELSYTIGQRNEIEVKARLQKDDILQISNDETNFIPLQQIGNASVKINTNDQPLKSGFYELKDKERLVKNLAFNYDRNESDLRYTDVKSFAENNTNIRYYNSVQTALNNINNEYKTRSLWQIFLLMAILFLLVEIGLLKFLKP